jgi:membrane-bound metal-dependent hydrolase YbcI (DUF457 family)
MKIPEHITLSFLLAQFGVQQEYGVGGTALVIAAGLLPDLDGLTILVSWRFYRRHHRILGHGLPVTLCGPALLAWAGTALGVGPFWPLWAWLQGALVVHLFTDVTFYNWPAQLLWPLSDRGWQFGLLTWNDLVPTLLLYGGTAAALLWPAGAPLVAGVSIGGVLLYLAWRAWRPRPRTGWGSWLTGGWAPRAAPLWRWLTGDFVT